MTAIGVLVDVVGALFVTDVGRCSWLVMVWFSGDKVDQCVCGR